MAIPLETLRRPADFANLQQQGTSRAHPLVVVRVARNGLVSTRYAFSTAGASEVLLSAIASAGDFAKSSDHSRTAWRPGGTCWWLPGLPASSRASPSFATPWPACSTASAC